MTSPQDPFTPPGEGSPPSQPGFGQQPPPYGQPPFGQQPPPYGQAPYVAPQGGTNGLAIGALITSFLCWPVGLSLGIIARGQIKRTGQGGSGLALAAIIISCIGAAIAVWYFAAITSSGAT